MWSREIDSKDNAEALFASERRFRRKFISTLKIIGRKSKERRQKDNLTNLSS